MLGAQRYWPGLISCLLGLSSLLIDGTIAHPAPVQQIAQIPGWKAVKGRGVELWLPNRFQGGNPTDRQVRLLINGLKTIGPEFAQIATLVEQNATVFALVAIDPPSSTGRGANVLVAAEQVLTTGTVEAALKTLAEALPPQIRIVEQKVISFQGSPAGRLVVETTIQNQTARQLIYVIKQRDILWTVGYSTDVTEFAQRLPQFEQSIQTFKAQPGAAIAPFSPKQEGQNQRPTRQ